MPKACSAARDVVGDPFSIPMKMDQRETGRINMAAKTGELGTIDWHHPRLFDASRLWKKIAAADRRQVKQTGHIILSK